MKYWDILICIDEVFGLTSVVHVSQLDATAVFVQLSKTELVSDQVSFIDGKFREKYWPGFASAVKTFGWGKYVCC